MPCIVQYRFETFRNLKSLKKAAQALGLRVNVVSSTHVQIGDMDATKVGEQWEVRSYDQTSLNRLKDEYLGVEVTNKAQSAGYNVQKVKDKKTNKITLRLVD